MLDEEEYSTALEKLYFTCFSVLRGSNWHVKQRTGQPTAKSAMHEVYSKPGYMRIEFDKIIRATEKAVLVQILGGKRHWFPKSVLSNELVDEGMLLVKEWFVMKEELLG